MTSSALPRVRPRMIASDLDGTLLGPDGLVSARTARAMQQARALGIELTIATGRPSAAFAPLMAVGFNGVVIAQNGAVVHDLGRGERRVRGTIPASVLREVVELIESRTPGIRCAIQVADDEGERHYADHAVTSAIEYVLLPRERMLDEAVVRALIWHPDPHGSFDWTPRSDRPVQATHSLSRSLLELSAPGITKAAALAEHAAAAGIDSAEVMAFGDMFNDIEMLAWSGWGVAMGNAPAEVQTVADAVVGSHAEDGVAAYLERVLKIDPATDEGVRA